MINITILGSTGSIGTNTLDVIARHPAHYQVFALTANSQVDKLFEQCLRFKPKYAVLADETAALQLNNKLKHAKIKIEVLKGEAGLIEVAQTMQTDYVVAGIVGASGLLPTLAAVKAGKRVLLANKEALIMAGAVFKKELAQSKALLLPLDSEHNAIFQCLPAHENSYQNINKIIITASGGPFRNTPLEQMSAITPEQACAHPIWKMGPKISVDSSTMMNKGLEVIEAHWLFDLPLAKIEVMLHPQSIVHSLVEYPDGSVLAQLGNPDMRIPIAHALAWPDRIHSGANFLDLIKVGKLEFYEVDTQRYPCLELAYQVLKTGGTAPALLNAANEVAVAAFLNKQIRYTEIYSVIATVLAKVSSQAYSDIETVLEADALGRVQAWGVVKNYSNR